MPHLPTKFLTLTAFVAASTAVVLSRQQRTKTALRTEIATAESRAAGHPNTSTRVVATAEPLPPLPSGDSDRDKTEAVRLKAELQSIAEDMNNRAQAMPPTYPLSARLWSNVGSSIPSAAIETLLWAARSGDVATIESLLLLTPEVRSRAEQLYAGLSPDERKQYDSASRLIAALTRADISTTSVTFVGHTGGADTEKLLMMFSGPGGEVAIKQVELTLNRSASGWKVVVPPEALDQYALQLKSADPARSPSL